MPVSPFNDTSIYWESAGSEDAPPLVMVHGSWSDHFDFAFLGPIMVERFRVITYDRRGHSASEAPPSDGTLKDDAEDLAAIIRDVCGGRAHVLGHSMGANATLWLAAMHPELVDRLAIHEPPLLMELAERNPPIAEMIKGLEPIAGLVNQGQKAEAAQAFVDNVIYQPGAWDTLPPELRATFTRNAETWLGELQDDTSTRIDSDALAAFEQPMLVSRGTNSPPFFAMACDLVAEVAPNVKEVTIAGADHIPHMTHVHEYAKILSDFYLAR